jgi:hypothetical protein
LHLGLAIFNGFAPVGLALFYRHGFQLLVWHQTFVSLLGGYGVDLGNGFGIAKRGGTNLDTGHGKTERKQGVKKQKGSALSPQTLFRPVLLVNPGARNAPPTITLRPC